MPHIDITFFFIKYEKKPKSVKYITFYVIFFVKNYIKHDLIKIGSITLTPPLQFAKCEIMPCYLGD